MTTMLLINMDTGYMPIVMTAAEPLRREVDGVTAASAYSRRQTMRVPGREAKKRGDAGFQNILDAEEEVYLTNF